MNVINRKSLGFALVLLVLKATGLSAETYTNLLATSSKACNQNNYKLALVCANKAIQMESNNQAAYLMASWIYLRLGQFDKALKMANDAIPLGTNSFSVSYSYFLRGCVNTRTTNTEEALADLNQAIHINPSFAESYTFRAENYIVKSNYNHAVIDANMAIGLNPNDIEAYRQKGYAYQQLQEHDKAILAFTKAIEMDTNSTLTYQHRGFEYTAIEDYSKAIADFTRIIQLNPKDVDAYSSRGSCLSHAGNFSKGIEDCKKAVQLDKSSDIALNNLAWLLTIAPDAKLRDGKRAVKCATRACDLSGWKNAYCLGTLAAAYAEIGKFDEAIKWEQKCIQIGLPNEKEMVQARKELELFNRKKPYHADN